MGEARRRWTLRRFVGELMGWLLIAVLLLMLPVIVAMQAAEYAAGRSLRIVNAVFCRAEELICAFRDKT